MPTMTTDEIKVLEAEAEDNDGRCPKCTQTIKIYRYTANKTTAAFMRAIADAVRNTGVNDIDLSTIGLAYSVRTQVAKVRQHGLIARVKDERGVQLASRWLVTKKGWDFINGKPIPKRVIVFNNQVLGHDGGLVTVHSILGEKFDAQAPVYAETPVSPAEARTYSEVRRPKRNLEVRAVYRGRDKGYDAGTTYDLTLEKLQVGQPVIITSPNKATYRDIAAFQKDWKRL